MSRARVLVIGLDAAEPTLLRRWIASGDLPHLARLFARGGAGRLETPSRRFPDLSFFSAYTGRGATALGRSYFIQPTADGGLAMLDHGLPAGEPFWVTASRHGRRCIALDTPKIGLHPPAEGVHLVGWGMHGSGPDLASHPASFAADVVARHGRYPLVNCDDHGRSPASYRRVLRGLLAGVEARRRLLLDLVRQPWDLFFAIFGETHCAGHQFWHFADPAHPFHRRDGAEDLDGAMLAVYAAVDRGVGDLLVAAGDDVEVILFSTQGMRPQYHGRDLVPTLLHLWGMREAANRAPDHAHEPTIRARHPLLKTMREAVPLPLQYVVKRALPQSLAAALVCRFVGQISLDIGARAYQVPNNEMVASLRIGVAGRDRHGRVAPGAEYRELRDFLAARLRELVNPRTGAAAMVAVDLSDDLEPGPYRDLLPDVTGYWSPEAPIEALYSPGYGTVVGAHRDYRTGGHAPDGLVWMSHTQAASEGADIRDLAPTILGLLGVPLPAGTEGRRWQ